MAALLMNGKVHEISQRRSSRNKRLGRGGFSSLHGLLGMALAAAALATPVSPASCRGGSNPPERRRGSAFSLPSRASFVQSASPEAWNPNRMPASKAGCCPSSARPSPIGNAPWFAALPRRTSSPSAATSMAMAKELGTALSCACASLLLLASPSSLQPPPARASLPVWAAESTAPAGPPAAAERKAGGGGEQAGGEKKQAATSEKAGVDKKPAAIAEPTIKLPQNPITPNKAGACSKSFTLAREGATAADPPRPVCRPNSPAAATSEIRRFSSQASTAAAKSVSESMQKVKAAEKRAADRDLQRERDLKEAKVKRPGKQAGGGEKEGGERDFAIDVQKDIVRKEKSRARAGMEDALEDAKTKYKQVADDTDKRLQDRIMNSVEERSKTVISELKKSAKEAEQKRAEAKNKELQMKANEQMRRAQEEEMIKQMEAGLEAPVTSTTPTIKIEKKIEEK